MQGKKAPDYEFLRQAGRILNAGLTRTLILSGNIHDLFFQQRSGPGSYVPLMPFLTLHWELPGMILVQYALNGGIRFVRSGDADTVAEAWGRWREAEDWMRRPRRSRRRPAAAAAADQFPQLLQSAAANPTLALELLRQLCQCSRAEIAGMPVLPDRLMILIETADLLIPEEAVSRLNDAERRRLAICQHWFTDPAFLNGEDSVVVLVESRSQLHHRIARLPQLLQVELPAPEAEERAHFLSWFRAQEKSKTPAKLGMPLGELAQATAGLSLHALLQLLKAARHQGRKLEQKEVVAKVETFIKAQLGEDLVEFKVPTHTLGDVVGFTRLKQFLNEEMIPRLNVGGAEALSGAAICGPIGGGKTFIFEAVAAEAGMVVLVLKNIRSQWFGQTDVLFERLRRVLLALSRVLIFVDEADTQLGGVGAGAHETERRLTGKIQAMMSDPRMRGKVVWLLVTARIHRLSPDLRRPGRVGDLIIPVLDPEQDADREAFVRWMVEPVLARALTARQLKQLLIETGDYFAASFASLRAHLKARAKVSGGALDFKTILALIRDHLAPAIRKARRYQTLQAMVNCTRRSLLPDPEIDDQQRDLWNSELKQLEREGEMGT